MGVFEKRSTFGGFWGRGGVIYLAIFIYMLLAVLVFATTFIPSASGVATSLHLESILSNEQTILWLRIGSVGLFLLMFVILSAHVVQRLTDGREVYFLTDFGRMIKESAQKFIKKSK